MSRASSRTPRPRVVIRRASSVLNSFTWWCGGGVWCRLSNRQHLGLYVFYSKTRRMSELFDGEPFAGRSILDLEVLRARLERKADDLDLSPSRTETWAEARAAVGRELDAVVSEIQGAG